MALKNFLEKINQDTKSNERPNKRVDPQTMPLSEFEKAGLIIKVYSEVLQEKIYFISSDAVRSNNPLDAVTYTAQELTVMLDMQPEELKAIHEVKSIFHRSRVIQHRRVAV